MREIGVGMPEIRVGMMGIRVGMWRIRVGMRETEGWNEGSNDEVLCIGVDYKKMRVSYCSVNVQKQPSVVFFRKSVLQKPSKFTGDHPCRSMISIKLHSKNSSINLHFWECRLV